MTRLQFHLVSAVGVLLLALAPALLSPFSITLLNFIGIYALAVLGLVLLSGIGGMLSFGQAAFVGIAAYATAWLTVKAGYSPWIGLVVGVVLTGLVAAVLGAVTLRLGGHFLSLSTIAWGLATYFLFGNVPMLGAVQRHQRNPADLDRRLCAREQQQHLLPDLGLRDRVAGAVGQPARFARRPRGARACAAARS